jgi:hypothetical protein
MYGNSLMWNRQVLKGECNKKRMRLKGECNTKKGLKGKKAQGGVQKNKVESRNKTAPCK